MAIRCDNTPLNASRLYPRMLHSRHKAFTLVELLTVMTIIVILLVVGIPLLSDPANSARQTARDILCGHLQDARAHAIATGNPTSVMFPDYSNSKVGGKLIGIAEVEPQTGSASPYQVKKILQRWTPLPENIFFLNKATTGASEKTLFDGTDKINADYQKSPLSCYYIVFAPNGQITYPPSTVAQAKLVLAIGKGFLKSNAVVPTQRNERGIVFDLLLINRLSARARNLDPK